MTPLEAIIAGLTADRDEAQSNLDVMENARTTLQGILAGLNPAQRAQKVRRLFRGLCRLGKIATRQQANTWANILGDVVDNFQDDRQALTDEIAALDAAILDLTP